MLCSCLPFTPPIGPVSLLRYTPRQIALLPGDAQHLVVVEADHNEYNETQGQVRGAHSFLCSRSETTLCVFSWGCACIWADFDFCAKFYQNSGWGAG